MSLNTHKLRDLVDQHRRRYDISNDVGEIVYALERLLDLLDVASEAVESEDEHAAMDEIRDAVARCGR